MAPLGGGSTASREKVAAENPCYHSSDFLRGGPAPGEFAVDFAVGLTFGGGGLPCYVRAVRSVNQP